MQQTCLVLAPVVSTLTGPVVSDVACSSICAGAIQCGFQIKTNLLPDYQGES